LKVAVSSTGEGLDAAVDPRFGRCSYYVIVETENMQFEAVPNASQYAPSGAGIQAAQIVANKGAKVVLTGNVGPNASQVLSSAGIRVITGVTGTVREAILRYKGGELKSMPAQTGMGYGMGGGLGLGMGRGGGRGMGRGRGMGMRMTPQPVYPSPLSVTPPQMTKDQEIQMLKSQMDALQSQLEQVKKRLKELGK
jgi:predicted Fe-Mo cluster-binding NifX family protein